MEPCSPRLYNIINLINQSIHLNTWGLTFIIEGLVILRSNLRIYSKYLTKGPNIGCAILAWIMTPDVVNLTPTSQFIQSQHLVSTKIYEKVYIDTFWITHSHFRRILVPKGFYEMRWENFYSTFSLEYHYHVPSPLLAERKDATTTMPS